ncbi:MAG: 3'-5' exonuclease, partial [Bacteroidota bacterium]|nr:3'-5' exonuclease [Bacteroidota bacterium]
MLDNLNPEDVLFIDIETAPQYSSFEKVPEKFQILWEKRSSHFRNEDQEAGEVYDRAGIYAEFGRIVCISAGFIVQKMGERLFRVKSFYSEDEKALLIEFNDMLDRITSTGRKRLCAHNGLEFDYPYIARRSLINGLKIPKILDIGGMKPWDVKDFLLDTMNLWKFGDYKTYTSLELLCAVFNIPTPKDDIDGSQVASVFWKENDLDRIARYCEKDVLATAQLL